MIQKLLIIVEHKNATPRKVCLEMMNYWAKKNADKSIQIKAFVMGENIPYALYESVSKTGINNIISVEQEGLNRYNPEQIVPIIEKVVAEFKPDVVMFGNTAIGKDLAPRLAEKMDAEMISDIVGINSGEDKLSFVRPVYGGKVLEFVDYKSILTFVTVRPNVLGIDILEQEIKPEVSHLNLEKVESLSYIVQDILQKEYKKRPLIEAEKIVCGGRGIQKAESFEILQELADLLDASVATSRMPVDLGWVPRDMLIGQSGKTVRPKLYMGFGVAGEIQHLAGMATASYIVAVNKNPAARIFDVADFGIVGDFFEVIPEIINELKKVIEK